MAVLPVSPAPISSPAPIMSTPAPMSTQPAQNMTPVPAPVTPRPSATIASSPTPSSAPTAPPIATVSPLTAVYDRNTADAARNVVRNEALALNLPAAPSTPSDPALVSAYMNAQARGLVPVLSFAPGQDQNTAMREALSRAGQWSPTGPTSLPQASSTSTTAYATPTSPGRSHPYTTRQRPGSDGYSFVDYNVSTITGEEVDSNGMPLRSGSSSGSGSSGSGSQGGSGTSGNQNGTNGQAGAGQSNQPMSSGEALLQQFLERQRDIGDLSVSEQNSIDAAGRAAGAAYDPIIAEAKEEKKQGMAKGLIAGGQSGGFLNSQIAGVAAFTPTQGGTFVGEGGSLYRLQDRYIGAIANLESKKLAAIQDAMVQRTKAIRTGKGEDLDRMKQAFDMAMQIDREKREVAQEGLDKLIKLQQLKKYEREDDMETFKSISEAGIDVDPEYFQDLDAKYKRPQGTYQALWDVQQDIRQDKAITDKLERQTKMYGNAEKIMSIADKFGANVPIAIDGKTYTYQGQDMSGVKTGTETDANGRMTYWQVDPRTKAVQTVDLGYIGSQKGWETKINQQGDVWRINPQTGEAMPMFPSEGQKTWGAVYPDGSQSPYRSPNDPYQGECAALCNDLYLGGKLLPSDFEGKEKALSSFAVDKNQVRVGDTFLMSSGTTGHVGFVEGVDLGPDGKVKIRAFESNFVPPGGGKISHGRPMDLNDPRLQMIARVPTDPRKLPPVGTDSPVTTMISGGRTPSSSPLGGFGAKPDAPKPLDLAEKISFQKFVREDPWVKQMPDIYRSFALMTDVYDKTVKQGSKGSKAPADQALVTLFNKMLDPGSVVREGEYARTAEGQSYLSRAAGFLEKAKQGGSGITDQERAQMVGIARSFFNRTYSEYNNQMDFYDEQGRDAGIDTEKYLDRVKVEIPAPSISPKLPPAPSGQVTVWDKYSGEYGYVPAKEANNSRYQRL